MAPIKKRARTRARAEKAFKNTPGTSQTHDITSEPTGIDPDAPETAFDGFVPNKKDKQRIKHSQLLSRIQKTAPGSKLKKRRRPNKKLVAGLEGLLDTLPDLEAEPKQGQGDEDEWEGISDEEDAAVSAINKIARVRRRKQAPDGTGKMVLKTLNSRPGAMKRRAKMEETEIERFRKNMAQMAQGQTNTAAGSDVPTTTTDAHNAQRWAALRGFIGQTMQQNAAFMK